MNKPACLLTRPSRRLKTALATAMFLGFGAAAYAGDLSVASNSVSVSNGGAAVDGGTKAIGSNGIVAEVNNVPRANSGLSFPTFAFTLQQSGVTDGTYTFAAGFTVDDENSDRRVEVYIPAVTMTFSGGVLSGSVASGQSIQIRGRNSNNTLTATATLSNNSATFDGATLSFNATNQLNKVIAEGGILADIVNTINDANTSHYTYGVFLKQTAGPDNIRFGQGAGGSFSSYPCADGSQFLLPGTTLTSTFSGSYMLQGRMSFAGGSGSYTTTLSAPAATCATFGSSPGPTPTPTTTTTSTTSSTTTSTAPTTTSTVVGTTTTTTLYSTTQLTNLTNTLTTLLSTTAEPSNSQAADINNIIASGIASIGTGNADVSAVFGLIDVLNSSLAKQGDGVENSTTVVTISLIERLVNSLEGKELSDTEKSTLLDKVADSAAATSTSVESKSDLTSGELRSSLRSLGAALGAAAEVLNNGVLSRELVDVASDLSQAAKRLSGNRAASNNATIVAETKVTLRLASSRILGNAIQSSEAESGRELFAATIVNALNPSDVIIETDSEALVTGLQSLIGAINISGSSANYVSSTGVTEIQAGTRFLPAFMVESALIGPDVPDGIVVSANGAAIAIKNALAATYVPASRDLVGLVNALESAGMQVTIESDGSLNLVTANGARFAGTFGFTAVARATLTSAPVTFTQPTGNPKSASYFFTVNYSDGSSQRVMPYVAADGFYDSLAALGFEVQTDRSTGVIVGPGGIRYRPGYFVNDNNAGDLAYHTAAKDSFDISYRRVDANADGLMDYEVLSSNGKQILYRTE